MRANDYIQHLDALPLAQILAQKAQPFASVDQAESRTHGQEETWPASIVQEDAAAGLVAAVKAAHLCLGHQNGLVAVLGCEVPDAQRAVL